MNWVGGGQGRCGSEYFYTLHQFYIIIYGLHWIRKGQEPDVLDVTNNYFHN